MPRRPLRPGFGPGGLVRATGAAADTIVSVTIVTPNAGVLAGGTAITITGTNFHAGLTVTLGGVAATSVVVVNDTTITAVSPAHAAGLVDLVITNTFGQTETFVGAFSYLRTVVSSLDPNHGVLAGGTSVVITGANFTTGMTVTFGGTAATGVTFIDSGHYVAITPNHAVGPVDVVVGDGTLRGGFSYTLLTRGEDIRTNPTVTIHEVLNSSPNTCTFRVDGRSQPPQGSEVVESTDFEDPPTVLFAGVIQTIEQIYEGRPENIAWNVTASDFTCWLNRRRPFGTYIEISASGIVVDLISRFAPWVTTTHVQANLSPVTIIFNGTDDFATCLGKLAKAIGGGHWYLDYDKDLHFFHVIPPELPNALHPASSMALGPGTAMTVTESATPGALTPGYYVCWTTFVYDNGMESAISPSSNMVLLKGHFLPTFTGIPIGPAIGSNTVVERWIYYTFFGNGVNQLQGWVKVPNNVATSLTIGPTTWQGVPLLPYITPPAGPSSAPSVLESGTTATVVIARIFDTYDAQHPYTFAPGTYSFVTTNVYRDGTESLPSPVSNPIVLTGSKGITIASPAGASINGVDVVYRKVYGARAVGTALPSFTPGHSFGWGLIPNNLSAAFELSPGVDVDFQGTGLPPVIGSTAGTTSTDGPWLEDDEVPNDITEGECFLNDPPITWTADYTQIRNRVIVIGQGVAVAPTVITPIDADTGLPIESTGTVDTGAGPLPVTATLNPYLGARVVWGAPFRPFPEAVIGSYDGFPMNDRWFELMTHWLDDGPGGVPAAGAPLGGAPRGGVIGGVGPRDPLGWMGSVTVDYARANPYTVFMDLPANTYVVIPPEVTPINPGDPEPDPEDIDVPTNTVTPETNIVRPQIQVDHIASQQAMGRIELDDNGLPTDGIHEIVIDDSSLVTQAQMYARANAELELFAWPIITVHYATRDRKSKTGRFVDVSLATPPISGTFVIQEVTIDQIAVHPGTDPRYQVRASSVKFDLDDLLLLIATRAGDLFSTTTLVEAAVSQAVNRIPKPIPVAANTGVFVITSAVIDMATQGTLLFTTGYELLPAPGPGQVIIPLAWTITVLQTTIGGSGGSWNLLYDDAAMSGFPALTAITADFNNNRNKIYSSPDQTTNWLALGSRTPTNKGLRAWLTSDPGLIAATTVQISLVYFEIPTLV
jgi:hypothetical protein